MSVCFLKSEMFRHGPAENIVETLLAALASKEEVENVVGTLDAGLAENNLKVVRASNFDKLLALGIDGPNVNISVKCKVNEKLVQE